MNLNLRIHKLQNLFSKCFGILGTKYTGYSATFCVLEQQMFILKHSWSYEESKSFHSNSAFGMKTLTSRTEKDSIDNLRFVWQGLLGSCALQPSVHVTVDVYSNTNSRFIYSVVRLLCNAVVPQTPFNVIWGVSAPFQEVTCCGEVFSHLNNNATAGVWKDLHTVISETCVIKHWTEYHNKTTTI